MQNSIRTIITQKAAKHALFGEKWVPENEMTRQEWQFFVEEILIEIRCKYKLSKFLILDSEISILYHSCFEKFIHLLANKIENKFD